jgi:hypothetical protein
MRTRNPFTDSIDSVTFPQTLAEIDELKARIVAHVARVTIEHAGLPGVLNVLDSLERHRIYVTQRSTGPHSEMFANYQHGRIN